VDNNLAPVLTSSFGLCEAALGGAGNLFYDQLWRQAASQGISVFVAAGDNGPAGCDDPNAAVAGGGAAVSGIASSSWATAVGGTMFQEGSGNDWGTSISPFGVTALGYIPEAAWNESGPIGLASTGGGASSFYSKPAWQTGPGVPNDSARDVPDISLSAAIHDSYLITYLGATAAIAGTSCSAPAFAGMLALLNQYQVAKGFQKQPGLGNINPQLYRLAQSAPSAFHDIISGDNAVSCAQGSPDCLTGSYGYPAGVGYDLATGLGTIDANNLVTQWNTQTDGVVVTFTASPTKATLNDTIQLTATVAAASGTAVPTGSVAFSSGGVALGSAALLILTFPSFSMVWLAPVALAARGRAARGRRSGLVPIASSRSTVPAP